MSDALLEPRVWSCLDVARYWCRMSGEEAKLKLKIEQAEAAVACEPIRANQAAAV